ncbi:unnamed protein product (macronuclear) [Paramecium tetraurelia]|uniref:Phosphagen kinase N-terminal domain-containing protein n=1 Tax=Paramecium tetraurelia TaxID=5888 RepID=A0CQV9_PARTE|nr:uncharacterized protein GSPATT00009525001 [Paramecium tetraurelia]CAK73176.1 unnamed protein product [Paramecium tetraurelia]|eukprot:XP_001440573.1 hypothetical protein (macronuclear) [Paramecium tetraurelia strain d4-2]
MSYEKKDVRLYFDEKGNVGYAKFQARWDGLKKLKVNLGNKHFTQQVVEKAKILSREDQQRPLDIMIAGLTNDDSSGGIAATRPEDYDFFLFYLETHIREYQKIEGQTKQGMTGLSLLVNMFLQRQIQNLKKNVAGYNLPSSMDKDERIKFENQMVELFEKFCFPEKYHSLTSGHKTLFQIKKLMFIETSTSFSLV